MAYHHPATMPEPHHASAAEFFEGTLPKILTARGEAARAIGGRLLVEVTGKGGGCWFVDLAHQRVFGGAPAQVDCTVSMTSDVFKGFLKGSVDAVRAARDRTVEVQGSVEALIRFAELISP
jgi:hypothetical protein